MRRAIEHTPARLTRRTCCPRCSRALAYRGDDGGLVLLDGAERGPDRPYPLHDGGTVRCISCKLCVVVGSPDDGGKAA